VTEKIAGKIQGSHWSQALLGEKMLKSSSTQNYLDQVGDKIKDQNSERDKGDIDAKLNALRIEKIVRSSFLSYCWAN
jgi:hypothetical protein